MEIKNVRQVVKETRTITMGDIYYIQQNNDPVGCEQKAGRPGIIVSNNLGNEMSNLRMVVYLTTQPKTELPTHVNIKSARYPSTAICEQIHGIDDARIGNYIGHCTDNEMKGINRALAVALDLNTKSSILFNTGRDEILINLQSHITRLVNLANKVAAVNYAIDKAENECIVNIPGVAALDNLFTSDDLGLIKQMAVDKLKHSRDTYYKQLSNLSPKKAQPEIIETPKEEHNETPIVNVRKKRVKIDEKAVKELYINQKKIGI